MEKKFGTFNTVEELNRAAAAQKAEGDYEALETLAIENGLEKEDAEDYFEKDQKNLCTAFMAAVGKLEMEAKELNLESQLKDWKDMVVLFCDEIPELSEAVFSPDKHLLDVLATGLKRASKNRVKVDKRITMVAGLPESAGQIGMIGKDELREIVTNYYLGGSK